MPLLHAIRRVTWPHGPADGEMCGHVDGGNRSFCQRAPGGASGPHDSEQGSRLCMLFQWDKIRVFTGTGQKCNVG